MGEFCLNIPEFIQHWSCSTLRRGRQKSRKQRVSALLLWLDVIKHTTFCLLYLWLWSWVAATRMHIHTPSHHQKSQPCFACATTTILTYKLLVLQCWSEAGTRERENFPCLLFLSFTVDALAPHARLQKYTRGVDAAALSVNFL